MLCVPSFGMHTFWRNLHRISQNVKWNLKALSLYKKFNPERFINLISNNGKKFVGGIVEFSRYLKPAALIYCANPINADVWT